LKRQLAAAGETQEQVDGRILEAITKFVSIAGEPPSSQSIQLEPP